MKSNRPQSQIIDELIHQNENLKRQLAAYKQKYNKLFVQYKNVLNHKQQHNNKTIKVQQINLQGIINDLQTKINSPRNHYQQNSDELLYQYEQYQKKKSCEKYQESNINTTKESPNQEKDSTSQQQNQFQMTLQDIRNSRKKTSTSEKPYPLIEGCFIIQKQKKNYKQTNLTDMVKYVYPPDLIKNQKQMLDLIVKYTFVNPQLSQTQDDLFNSRRNQIMYGTPYQDLIYAFQDNKWNNKKQIPSIMKQMNIMKKKYVNILLTPQIVELDQEQKNQKKNSNQSQPQQNDNNVDESMSQEMQTDQFLQTQVIYGFISPFPLRSFFQDLHRTIQQQVKYNRFSKSEIQEQSTITISNDKKYQIVGKIMKKIVEQQYKISSFPIKYTYQTGVSKVQLNIPSIQAFNQIQNDFLKYSLNKYSINNMSRLIHYVLAQRFIIIQAKSRKILNQMFQIIRIIMKPFLWLFATVYIYSDYFQPFMSSPMPIIIGRLKTDKKNNKKQQDTGTQFIIIDLDDKGKELKQKQIFYKSIKKLKKQLEKGQDKTEVMKKYVNNLKTFVGKGVLDQQPTDFHIQLIETQLVSYFKDVNEK